MTYCGLYKTWMDCSSSIIPDCLIDGWEIPDGICPYKNSNWSEWVI